MVTSYDAAVLGLGGMGSAALYHLARRGLRVCGIEQYPIAHDRGSSHGALRIIRKAYFEHPDYVPLLERAYALWHALEADSGERLMDLPGLVLSAPAESAAIAGLTACYHAHALPHERLTAADAMARWPQFRLPETHNVFFDPEGGYLRVEPCVATHVHLAERYGAAVHASAGPATWRPDGDGVVVSWAGGTIQANRLVIAGGPWSAALLKDLGLPLTIRRKVQLWFDTPNRDAYTAGFPCYYVAAGHGEFYGFPIVDAQGMKVAEHSGGAAVSAPSALNRSLEPADEAAARQFLEATFPGMAPRLAAHSVCMYTMTPDEHFIIDTHPAHPQVAFAAGFSGHGFKFASVIGEVLAGLAELGDPGHPTGFLRLSRFTEK